MPPERNSLQVSNDNDDVFNFVVDSPLPPNYTKFNGCTFCILGFGSIAKGLLPLILRHIDLKPEQVVILTQVKDKDCVDEAIKFFGVRAFFGTITSDQNTNEKMFKKLGLQPGDFMLNLTADVGSNMLIRYANRNKLLYMDTTTDVFPDDQDQLTNRMRKKLLEIKDQASNDAPTALTSHGANPGMVNHFVKQALVNMAKNTGLEVPAPLNRTEWAMLARDLQIKTIQISEYDTQQRIRRKNPREFVSTWSVDAFMTELASQSEFGWGTHETEIPADGKIENECMVLDRPAVDVLMRSWSPLRGSFYGFCGSHSEALSIADYLSIKDKDGNLIYRPTVMFVYRPCDDAVLSAMEFAALDFEEPKIKTILEPHEITDGVDELGVLLGGNEHGCYWYGSQLSSARASTLVEGSQATTLQVTATALAGILWVLENPNCGVVEPDELPYRDILDFVEPYVAPIVGVHSSWSPTQNHLESEQLCTYETNEVDENDPWQLKNIRV